MVCIFSQVDISCEVKHKQITIHRNTEVRYRIKDQKGVTDIPRTGKENTQLHMEEMRTGLGRSTRKVEGVEEGRNTGEDY